MVQNPSAGLAPMKTQAIQNVNQTYAPMADNLMESLASRGFGRSGQAGVGMRQIALGRAGALTGLEPQFAQMALQRQMGGISLAEALLGLNRGQSMTGSSTSDSTTTQTPSIFSSLLSAGSLLAGIPGLGGSSGPAGYSPGASASPSSILSGLPNVSGTPLMLPPPTVSGGY